MNMITLKVENNMRVLVTSIRSINWSVITSESINYSIMLRWPITVTIYAAERLLERL